LGVKIPPMQVSLELRRFCCRFFTRLPGIRRHRGAFCLGACRVHGGLSMQQNNVIGGAGCFPLPDMAEFVLQNFPLSPSHFDEVVPQRQFCCGSETRRTHRNFCCPIPLRNHLDDGPQALIPDPLGISRSATAQHKNQSKPGVEPERFRPPDYSERTES